MQLFSWNEKGPIELERKKYVYLIAALPLNMELTQSSHLKKNKKIKRYPI